MGITKFLKLFVVLTGMLLLFTQHSYSQSSTQVNIVGIPPVLTSPFADNIETNFKTGQYQVIFNYSSFSSQPVDFVFEFTLRRNNRTIIEFESLPRAFTPGSYVFSNFFEEVDFPFTPKDVLNQLDKELQNQVVQSGSIPEGNYSIEITARPNVQQSGINSMPGNSIFTVRYPPSPILVSVPDGANLLLETPTFSWTPVASSMGGLFEYEFLLVEVFKGQTPLQAINSNREHAFETLTGQTTLPYTLQYLPLEEGATYAWQVTAKDANGQLPIQNDGESEIYTFTYRDKGASDEVIASLDELKEIPLVPGFATVNNFERMRVEETPNSFILSGLATLNLDFVTLGPVSMQAELDRVEIQKSASLQTPILMGGKISARSKGIEELAGPLSDYVEIPVVTWDFASGIGAELNVKTPAGSDMRASGDMSLNRMGLSGQASINGTPLVEFGEGPLSVELTSLTVTYPEAQLRAKTNARFLGEELCETPEFPLLDDNFRIRLDCTIDKDISMVDQSDLLVLNLEDVSGEIIGSLNSDEFDFNLAMRSNIDLKMEDDQYCGGSTFIQYSSEDGFSAGQFTPNCTIPRPELDLGFLKASVNNIELEQLSLSEEGNELDFEVWFDSQLSFPNNPTLALPALEGVRITNSGITFPDALFDGNDIPVNNTFELGDFELQLERFELDPFTFPWFDWDGEGVGPWSFNLDAGLELPVSAELPGCFSSTTLGVENASISSDGDGEFAVMGTINADNVASCSWELGPGFSMDIHNIGGDVVMKRASEGFSVRSDITFDADLNVDEPFACSEQSSFELNDLSVSLDSGLNGNVSIQNPDCPLQIGPYTADINQAEIEFNYNDSDGQQIALSGGASLDLGDGNSADGTFTMDLKTGLFTDINFEIDGPFEWGIPKEDPVLAFTIDEASLSNEGMMINGRQTLDLGETEIGTTFDQLLIDWDTYEILGGRIIFDEAFNLTAGVDLENNALQFEASTDDTTASISPGVMMGLAGTVQIDSSGVRSAGTAAAALNIDGLDIGDLEVEYSDDFAIELNPFRVQSGEVNFNWNEQRVAYANNSGFFPDLSFFSSEFLPDRIPLPNNDVAYLQIRDEDTGELIISTERQDNGTFLIETLEDQELMLTLPLLQRGDEAVPPSVAVQLNDLIINPSNGTYVSGSVYTSVQEGSNLANRPNLPFNIKEIQYSNGENADGDEMHALFLSGSLNLFEQELEGQDITLYADSDGFIRGGVDLPDLNTVIPLEGPGGHVVLSADSLGGGFEWNPQNIAASQFNLDIVGGFEILDFDGNPVVRSQVSLMYDEFGINLKDFSLGEDFDGYDFNFGFFDLKIPSINTLNLSYDPQQGFDYHADLDFNLSFDINGQSIPFPLENVEIRKDLGFVIPSQDIHDGSFPGLSLPSVEFGAFKLEPLALRMDRDTIDVNNFTAGDLLDIMPDLDFEFSMPGFQESIPELANLNMTVQGANFSEGIFNGNILPLEFDEVPLFLPLGSGAGINLSEIGGSLFAEDDGQGFSIQLDGGFVLPDFFSDADESCAMPNVQLDVTRDGYFSGQLSNFEPCGDIDLGGLKLNFGETLLEFSHEDDEQLATIDGGVTVELENTDGDLIEATGSLKYDLINGGIVDGSVQIDSQFPWNFPRNNSIFKFYVNSATLNSNGLVINADGGLNLEDDVSIDATFNNLTLDLSTFELTDGSVEFDSPFALDVGFGPRTWSVKNPATAPEFDNGVRMTIPGNMELSHDGLLVNGEAGSALYFGDEIYDGISVDFINTRFLFSPDPQISEGRADFLHQEDGEDEPERLAWFDSDGFHPDNLAGAVSLPDTLGLPDKDIAYIVLKDDQGQNLVQSENVEDGLKIFTTDPVDLVIESFSGEFGESYSVSVTFDSLIVNSALEVTSGSIIADLTDTPLSLQEDMPLPIGVQKLEYRNQSGEHKLFADVQLDLPGELSQIAMIVEDLLLTKDGFEDVNIALGEYSETYDADVDTVIASSMFADDNFEVAVRGAEFGFGSDRYFRFSGDIRSQLFRNDEDEQVVVHLAAGYENTDWNFSVDTAHLVPQKLPIGMSELILDDVGFEQIEEDFALVIDSRLKLPEILGEETEIGINGLRVGTGGVSLEEVDTEAYSGQKLTLFGQQDILTIASLGIEITDDLHLIADLSGSLEFLERTFDVDDLKIGTDGTFSVGDGGVNLIGDGPKNLLGDNLILTTLEIGMVEDVATLTALADLTLPEPVETNSTVGLSINQLGEIDIQQPDINFSGVSKEIPGFATISLDDAEFELNSLEELDFGFYAMASVEAGGETIEFGQAGNTENWGIRYQYGGSLEWRITNSPSFEFENEMFAFNVDGVSAETEESFVLQMNVGAELKLAGVSGSIAFDGMEIDAGGEFDLGTFSESDLDMGPVSVTIESFEYLPDGGTITLDQESGSSSDENPEIESVDIEVSEYLTFGGSMTLPGFSGNVKEILYYRQGSDIFFSVKDFNAELSDMASITASLEYQTVGSEFELLVAGAAEFTPPEGDTIGLAAMGRMGNIGGEFSFGIFVKADVTVPVFPGALTMTSFGAGFFYNAKSSDFDHVLSLTDHEITSDSPPWEIEGGSYDFAIIAYAGVGLIGEAGTYAIEGSAILLITDSWLVLDLDGQIFDGEATIDVGMYLSVQWNPSFQLDGQATASLDNSIAYASFDLSITILKNQDETIWGVEANIDVEVLSVITLDGTFIAGNDGFYAEISKGHTLDVSIISASVNIDLSLWWVRGEQFGAFVEFDASASILAGTVSGSVSFKGGLIVDSGYLIYAYGKLEAEVLWGAGSATYDLNVSIENGKIDGGRGSNSDYERALRDAQEDAENMNDNITAAIDAAQDLSSVVQDRSRDTEALAQAGEKILGDDFRRKFTYAAMRMVEKSLTGDVPPVYDSIYQAIIDAEDIPEKSDYNLQMLQQELDNTVDILTTSLNEVNAELSQLEAVIIEYQEDAETSLEDILESPVQNLQTTWNGDQPPSFDIEPSQDSENRGALEDYKVEVEAMEQKFEDAITGIQSNITSLENVLFSDELGLNRVAKEFHDVTLQMDKLYANLASLYWDMNRWAINSRNLFLDTDTDLSDAVVGQAESMLDGEGIQFDFEDTELLNPGSSFTSTNFFDLTHIAAVRSALVEMNSVESDGFNSAYNSEKGALEDMVDADQYANFANSFVTRAKEFWYDVPMLGYTQLRDDAVVEAEAIDGMYENALSPLKVSYVQFTNRIDDLYGNKHAIHATYESILRHYITWREDVFVGDDNSQYETLKSENAEQSKVPNIGSISMSYERDGFVNKVMADWNVTHSSGINPENSYYISDNSGSLVFNEEFLSIGSDTDLSRFLFKRSEDEDSRDMTIRVRARGPSGLSITRSETFTRSLNPSVTTFGSSIMTGNWNHIGTDFYGGGLHQPQEGSKPETPTLEVPYPADEYVSYIRIPTPQGMMMEPVDMARYWTNNSNSLEFTASSFDEELDIASFKYMVGTSPGDSTLVGWTQQLGTPVNGSASNEQHYEIYNLNLLEGEEYYITVRAINGGGVESDPAYIGPIKYDETPPTQPGSVGNAFNHPTVVKLGDSGTFNSTVSYGSTTTRQTPPKEDAVISINWSGSSTSSGSGIYGYKIVVSEHDTYQMAENDGEVFFSEGTSSGYTISTDRLDFETEYYFYVLAEDYAGNTSDPIQLGPEMVVDPTSPTAPSIVAKIENGILGVSMPKGSIDRESGLDYYEYTFINENSGQIISGAGGEYDPSSNQQPSPSSKSSRGTDGIDSGIGGFGGSSTTNTFIPLNTSNLTEGVPLRVVFKAVNNQGEKSHTGESGPIIYDSSKPEITVSALDYGDHIEIIVNSAEDPESGITDVDYKIVSGSQTIKDWTTMLNIISPSFSNVSSTKTFQLNGLSADNLEVIFRVRNGNGMEKTKTKTPTEPIQIIYMEPVFMQMSY
ncbi:prefoldin domain-containing protein [Rhodohalobacter barkolensis]|uniref:Uncharacterized protein n=1 Tax=Rhodohalobacter barkolensis TaxID=2053187 RepID=A0A2N0VJB4_9BACT|nr:prefoldin domain-containing protein [Rhodohalobacter barkolensis]PKD44287.1 hypothetical protein CWD77_02125 [Rhodohalobacter barkolensis]